MSKKYIGHNTTEALMFQFRIFLIVELNMDIE